MSKRQWTLASAANFLRELESELAPHYHVGLIGSVLQKGLSNNDLDIVVIPHSSTHNDYEELSDLFKASGLKRRLSNAQLREMWLKHHGSVDEKFVEKWGIGIYRRIDIFMPYMSH